MTTIATLFSGFELVGVGARQAGLSHLWGVEWDDAIAGVARTNGFHTITADVLDIDPHTLPVPDVLHASPVCTRASVANQSAEVNEDGLKESPLDIAMGEKVAQFIDVMTPRVVTIENVYGYRKFRAFKAICAALDRNGYFWDFDNLNTADYGVPQTRRRLILRAVRGALLPNLPAPERWVGWYEAIEDLIPGLPESQFAPWQLARLPEEIKGTFAFSASESNNTIRDIRPYEASEPFGTIKAGEFRRPSSVPRAFILDCQLAGDTQERGVTLRQGDAPVFAVTSGKGGRQPVRAFLVGTNANDTSQAKIYQEAGEPAQVVRTPSGGRELRAYLVESKNIQEWGDSRRADNEPAMTVNTDHKPSHAPKAWLSAGRVVSMTPRALARFQSVPDSYLLPDDKRLSCKGIGNGFPPLAYQKLIAPLVENL